MSVSYCVYYAMRCKMADKKEVFEEMENRIAVISFCSTTIGVENRKIFRSGKVNP